MKLPSNKAVWNLTYPIILSLFAENIINVTDTAFLARVGEAELGAAAIGGTFYVILFIIGLGFGIGTQIIISRRIGQNRPAETAQVFMMSSGFLMIAAGLLFLVVNLFGGMLFSGLLSSSAVSGKATLYVHYRIWGIFFTFMSCAFRALYTGIFKTRYLAVNAAILAVVNVIFAWLLIFGKLGFPAMGIAGAAIATVIAEAVSMVYFLVVTLWVLDRRKYGFTRKIRFDGGVVLTIYRVSGFIILQHLMSLTAWFCFFLFIEKRGEHDLAVVNIIRSIYIFLMIPVWAFSSATNTLVSNIIGEGNHAGVMPLIAKTTRMGGAIMSGIVLLALILPVPVLHLFSSDAALIAECLPSYYVITASLVLLAFTMNYFSGVLGTGKTQIGFMIEIAGVVVYTVYAWFSALYFHWPLWVVWFAEPLYFIIYWVISYTYLRSGKWQKSVL